MKIVQIIPTLDRSGAEKQFALLASRLPRDEFDVHAVALNRGGPYADILAEHHIPLTVLGKKLRFDPGTYIKLRRLLRRLKPDIVHSWLFAANTYSRMIAPSSGPKIVVSERCVDSWKSWWQLSLDRRLISKTDRLVANSNSVGEFYRDLGMPENKITVIPNGTEPIETTPEDRLAVRREFSIPDDARVVGYVGRLAKQKRVQDLVWALHLLKQCTENVYMIVVGDGPEQRELQALAGSFKTDHLLRFVGHRSDTGRILSAIDVFWLASEFEGMSNSVMEAMSAGIPVVATDIPSNRELVVDGETGFLVNVGDSVGFSQFADRIFADEELRTRLGAAARKRIAEEFSIDAMVDAHVHLYRQLVTPG